MSDKGNARMHAQTMGGPTYHQLAVNTNWSTQEHANLTLILPCAKGCNSYPQKHLSSLAYLQTIPKHGIFIRIPDEASILLLIYKLQPQQSHSKQSILAIYSLLQSAIVMRSATLVALFSVLLAGTQVNYANKW